MESAHKKRMTAGIPGVAPTSAEGEGIHQAPAGSFAGELFGTVAAPTSE